MLREFYNKISEKKQLNLNFRLFDEFLTNRVYIINAEDNAKFKWDFIRQGIDFHFFANKTKPFNRHRCLSLLLIDAHSHKTFLFAWLSVVSSPFICSIYWLLLNCQDARSAKRSNWWWWWWSFCRFWYQNSEKKKIRRAFWDYFFSFRNMCHVPFFSASKRLSWLCLPLNWWCDISISSHFSIFLLMSTNSFSCTYEWIGFIKFPLNPAEQWVTCRGCVYFHFFLAITFREWYFGKRKRL